MRGLATPRQHHRNLSQHPSDAAQRSPSVSTHAPGVEAAHAPYPAPRTWADAPLSVDDHVRCIREAIAPRHQVPQKRG